MIFARDKIWLLGYVSEELAKSDLLTEPIKRCLKDGEYIRSRRNQSVKGIKKHWADESDEMDWDLLSAGDPRRMLLVSD